MTSIPQGRRGRVLLVATGLSDAGVLLAKAFVGQGLDVVAYCSHWHLLCKVGSVRAFHPSLLRSRGRALQRLLRRECPDLLVPCDDEAVRLLHALWRDCPESRLLVEKSLGDPSHYDEVVSRAGFFAAVERCPEVRQPAGEWLDASRGWSADLCRNLPLVLKREASSAGEGVRIATTAEEAARSYRDLVTLPGALSRIARAVVRAIVYNFDFRLGSSSAKAVLVQRYQAGARANCATFCRDGEVLAQINVEVVSSRTETGPSSTVKRVDNKDMDRAARFLAKKFGLNGFHGFDFIVDDAGKAWLLEINLRATPVSHLPFGAGQDLVAACCGVLAAGGTGLTAAVAVRPSLEHDLVAMFPREIAADPASPHLRLHSQDVPWDEPQLLVASLRRTLQVDTLGRLRAGLRVVQGRALMAWIRGGLEGRSPRPATSGSPDMGSPATTDMPRLAD